MRKILFVLTNTDKLGETDRETGAYFPEISHPYDVFRKNFTIDFASPKGGRVPLISIDKTDPQSAKLLNDSHTLGRIQNSFAPQEIKHENYVAIFYAGGHGTMWDFPDNKDIQNIAAGIYQNGGVVGAVCHGPAGLVNIKLENGEYLVKEKKISAFTNEEESEAGLREIVPFLLENKLIERGADYSKAANWQKHVISDQRLVTGQNPASASGVAKVMSDLLLKKNQ